MASLEPLPGWVPAEALRRVYEKLDGVEPELRDAGLEYVADDVAEIDAALLELLADVTPTPSGSASGSSGSSE